MSGIVRQDDVRRLNQFGLLRALRRHGPLSRTALSSLTGLSPSTVTVITNSLIERGLLTDRLPETATVNKRGRPQVLIAPDGNYATVATIRLARGVVETALFDYAGRELGRRELRRRTLSLAPESIVRLMVELVDGVAEEAGRGRANLVRIAVAVEGIVDSAGRLLLSTPFADVHEMDIASLLEAEFGVSAEVMNDCNAVAEGLTWTAPEASGENFAALLMANGVGLGLAINGKMLSGPKSSGMEFGHMIYKPGGALCRCGRHGCIEAYAGIYAIRRAVAGQDPNVVIEDVPENDTLVDIVEKARRSDGPERQALKEAGRAIGNGLVNLFTLFDGVPLIMAGASTVALDFMMDEIRAAFANQSFGREVEPDIVDVYPDAPKLMRQGAMLKALAAYDMSLPDQVELVVEADGR
ncbi:ROK family transcriptional regulator [Rhizobium sp. C1]|uniref:ROK family transcriptional regulator n=1 Tax=Rhizobium sp. C1 TaxID=1349799 RepID=UPI001E4B4C43|nr:ROK family transcriptional regulator [Rhizobium sp. C1]MCD2178098.1 ROK family transcriptional regulator [Rhizobium sp. C1]